MNVLKTFTYQGVSVDIYQEHRKELYATVEQLANALGYKSKNGIELLLNRNPHLKEKAYSIVKNIPVREYEKSKESDLQSVSTIKDKKQYQETRLFTRLGIYEVVSLCTTKQAKEIRLHLFRYIEWLEKELYRAVLKHTESKDLAKMLNDAVDKSPVYCEYEKTRKAKMFTNFNRLINRTASGGRTTRKKELQGNEFTLMEQLQHRVIVMLNGGYDYGRIRDNLLSHVMIPM